MSESTIPSDGTVERSRRDRDGWPSRYDVVLAAIPLAFLAAALAATVGPVSLQAAIRGATVLGVLVVADALFVNPPRGSGRR